jgi:hypothetical protein
MDTYGDPEVGDVGTLTSSVRSIGTATSGITTRSTKVVGKATTKAANQARERSMTATAADETGERGMYQSWGQSLL